ncbi:MAG: GNAT family N-acetyltransferase [Gammaproteobacteria bacterium]
MRARITRDDAAGKVRIRPMTSADAKEVQYLILTVFDEFVAPGYSRQASKTFRRQTRRQLRRTELRDGETRLVAVTRGDLIGVIGLRDISHIHWLWVRKDWHHKGIARNLIHQAVDIVRDQEPRAKRITLNSSPYAIPFYLRLGFHVSGGEFDQKGIICTPMVLELEEKIVAAGGDRGQACVN